jgi:TolB-like protein
MKGLSFFSLLLICGSLFAQNVSLDQALQTSSQAVVTRLPQGSKVAVLSFASSSQNFSDYVIDEIAIALSAGNRIQVIERQYMDVIRRELNIQMSGDVSDDEVRRVGRQLGAQFVVTGSLVDIGNAYRFRLAAINVETAVREGASSLNININDPQVVFLLTGQREQPGTSANTQNPFIGRWQAIVKSGEGIDVICILSIEAGGTITVERYDTYTLTRTWERRTYTDSYSYYRNGRGTGTYTIPNITGNTIQTTISLNLTNTGQGSLSVSRRYTVNIQNPNSLSFVQNSGFLYNGYAVHRDYRANIIEQLWFHSYDNFNRLR